MPDQQPAPATVEQGEKLEARARLILQCTKDAGRPATLHHLSETAARILDALSPEERHEAVHAAQRLANREEEIEEPIGRRQSQVRQRTEDPGPEGWNPERLRDFVRTRLERDPEISFTDLWKEVTEMGTPHITMGSFTTSYFYPIRKELRSSEPAPPSAPAPAAAAPADRDEEPELVPAERSSLTLPAPPRSSMALSRGEPAPGPGMVEIAGGGDAFRASRRDDGGWDVEFRAHVDEGLMGQLAGLLWGRVVGIPRDEEVTA